MKQEDRVEDRVKFVQHNGSVILEIDFTACTAAEMLARIKYARSVIAGQAPNSLRTLTLVTDGRFNPEVADALKEYTTNNKPYVKIAAVVGLSGLQQIVYNVIIKVTGRKIATFSDVEKAKDYLTRE